MKTIFAISIICFHLTLISAQNYHPMLSESKIEWKGYGEVGGFTQSGTINLKNAFLTYDGSKLSGKIIIDMSTINHKDKELEKHLKNKDFFNVIKYPTSTFTIISYDMKEVKGILELNGFSKEVNIDVHFSKVKNQLTINGKTNIDRTQFNIKYNSASYFQDLGNYAIKNEFDLEFELLFKKV